MWLVHLSSCRQTVNRIFCRLQRYSPGQCLLASRISCKCTLLVSKIATSKATANIKHINKILKHKSNTCISKGNHKEKSISLQGNTLKLSGFLPPKPLPMQRSLGRQHGQNSVCEDITIFIIQRIWTLISRGREIIVFWVVSTAHRLLCKLSEIMLNIALYLGYRAMVIYHQYLYIGWWACAWLVRDYQVFFKVELSW